MKEAVASAAPGGYLVIAKLITLPFLGGQIWVVQGDSQPIQALASPPLGRLIISSTPVGKFTIGCSQGKVGFGPHNRVY
jgi:hypothetical protein